VRRAPDAEWYGPVDAQAEEILVVAQLDVEARLVLLDELILEDRRFLLADGDHRLEVAHDLAQDGDEVPGVGPTLLEVAADARAQALRLADVDDLPLLAEEEVTARRSRQRVELGREHVIPRGGVRVGRHAGIFTTGASTKQRRSQHRASLAPGGARDGIAPGFAGWWRRGLG
jgi:hypothetical protein